MLDCFLRLFNPWWERWKRFLRDKDDLEFASMQVVTDDDLVAVSFESLTGFWDEKVLFCFELFLLSVKRAWMRRKSGLTLKETMNPPGVHSSTIGFRILGT